MGEFATLAPAGGVLLALAIVVGYLVRSNMNDRKFFWAAVESQRADCQKDVVLLEQRIESQMAAYRTLQGLMDSERTSRRKAEDDAARAIMTMERASYELAALRSEIKAVDTKVSELKEP